MRTIPKKVILGLTLLLIIFTVSACSNSVEDEANTDFELTSIEIDESTILPTYEVGEFVISDVVVILHFERDFTSRISLTENMINYDLLAFNEEGTYEVTVEYLDETTSFTLVFTEGLQYNSLSIDEETYNPYSLIDTFDLSNIRLEVLMSDETVRYVNLAQSMVDEDDLALLDEEGIHDITVEYQGLVTSFRIAMFDSFPVVEEEATLDEQIFDQVMTMLMDNHYTKPSESLLFEGALYGMIDILDDPFTTYFDAEEALEYQSNFEETYVGIGVQVQMIDDKIVVEGVMNGGAAKEEGMMVGDIIRRVDGVSIDGKNIYEIVNLIKGEEGTFVEVGVERPGVNHIIVFNLQRRVIDNPSVVSELIMKDDQPYGLITVNLFGDETAGLFATAVEELENQNIEGLIIDLRNNGGGRLDTVLSMMREFLVYNNQPIFTLEYISFGQDVTEEFYGAQSSQKNYDIVTLINEGSASASEVFASGMQEQGEYTVIGTTSYGKGTMQTNLPVTVTDGDFLKITLGKWLTTDGNWVHFNGGTNGITPDIVAELTPIEYAWKIYLSSGEELTYDTVSPRNANLQVILKAMGYTVRTDGYYDTATKQAIEDIQTTEALTVSGHVDEATMIVINDFLRTYQNDQLNDSQLQEAIDYFTE